MGKNPTIKKEPVRAPTRALGEVVTLSEACILTDASRGAIVNHCITRKISFRRSITGGEWLIDLNSLINHYPNAGVKLWLVR